MASPLPPPSRPRAALPPGFLWGALLVALAPTAFLTLGAPLAPWARYLVGLLGLGACLFSFLALSHERVQTAHALGRQGRAHALTAQRLEAKRRFLRTIQYVTQVSGEARTVEEALRGALGVLCRQLRWTSGHLHLRSARSAGDFSLDTLWPPVSGAPAPSWDSSAPCLIAQLARVREPIWIDRLGPSAARGEGGPREEPGGSALAFPVWAGSHVVALIELFSDVPRPRDEKTLEVIEHVAEQLSRVVERLHSQQALQRYLKELADQKLALDASSIVSICNPDGRILYVNDRFCEISKYSREELAGKDYRIVNSGHHPKAFFRDLWKTIREGNVWKGDIRNRAKDDSLFWVSTTIVPFLDSDGRPYQYLTIHTDITQHKQMEEALRESEDRYRDLFENANDLIQSIAPDGRLLYVNRAWREALGYSAEEVPRLYIFDVIHPDSQSHCRENFERLLRGDPVEPAICKFVTKTGSILYVEGTSSCRYKNGQPVATRSIFRDVTERRAVERMKNEFISVVSHELRTPLTSIRGSLGLLTGGAAGEIPPEAAELIAIANDNSERLVRLINDFLDIEKIESGRMEFRYSLSSLPALVARTIQDLRGFADQYGVEVQVHPKAKQARVWADEDRLLQVLTNLISNAIKFSPPGQRVGVELEPAGERVRVSVLDRGPGVPPSARTHLFTKFFQADVSDGRAKGGTGLGLNIVKSLVEQMGGAVGYEPRGGGGSRFWFELPATEAPAARAPAALSAGEDLGPTREGRCGGGPGPQSEESHDRAQANFVR